MCVCGVCVCVCIVGYSIYFFPFYLSISKFIPVYSFQPIYLSIYDSPYLLIYLPFSHPRGVMVKAMNCGIVVLEFVLQSRYYVHFRANTLGKGMNPLILPPAMDK